MQLSPVNGLPMLIEDWPIARVRPYPNNPRVLRNAAEKVAESIKAFGWRQPIVVDAEGVIIAGHGRHAAAQLLKLKKVPVHVAADLTPDQVRALRVAEIVRGMTEAGLAPGEICRRLGMEDEELERLLDRSGMTVRGAAGVNGFGRAWVPGR